MRNVIQSRMTGCFLAPSLEDGQPEWVMLLSEAAIVEDVETCLQIIEDHVDFYHRVQLVDLDDIHGLRAASLSVRG